MVSSFPPGVEDVSKRKGPNNTKQSQLSRPSKLVSNNLLKVKLPLSKSPIHLLKRSKKEHRVVIIT